MRSLRRNTLTPGDFVFVVVVLYAFVNGGVALYRMGGFRTLNLIFFLIVAVSAIFFWSLNHYRRQRSDESR